MPGIDETEISVAEASALTDALLLDVREDDEWAAGHIDGAVHVPMAALHVDHPAIADRQRLVVCVCRSGNRSRRVTDALNAAGWTAKNLTGGMRAWAAEGRPVSDGRGGRGTVI